MKISLVIGGGHTARKRIDKEEWDVVVKLDNNPECKPDVLHDLESLPLPFEDSSFNEIHAYEILEHTGRQGDYQFFFAQFGEFWRILQNGGKLFGSCPAFNSVWAWGDPGHTRIISAGTLVFLCRTQYENQLKRTSMSDYRRYLVGDWNILKTRTVGESFEFILEAIK